MRKYASKKSYRHMTQDKAEEIRKLYFSRVLTQKQLADKYQISQSAVCRIISGWTWMREKYEQKRHSGNH